MKKTLGWGLDCGPPLLNKGGIKPTPNLVFGRGGTVTFSICYNLKLESTAQQGQNQTNTGLGVWLWWDRDLQHLLQPQIGINSSTGAESLQHLLQPQIGINSSTGAESNRHKPTPDFVHAVESLRKCVGQQSKRFDCTGSGNALLL